MRVVIPFLLLGLLAHPKALNGQEGSYAGVLSKASVSRDTSLARRHLQDGSKALASSRWSDAIDSFQKAGLAWQGIADWAEALTAVAAAGAGDVGLTDRAASRSGQHLSDEYAWRYRLNARFAAGDTAGVIRVGDEMMRRLHGKAERARAAYSVARAHFHRGSVEATVRAARAVFAEGADTPAARDAADLLVRLGKYPDDLRPVVARIRIGQGRARDALALIGNSGATASREIWDLRYDAGVGLARLRECAEAGRALSDVVRNHPDVGARARAGYELGACYIRSGDQGAAEIALAGVTRSFPSSESAGLAHFLLGDMAHDAVRTQAAFEHYRQAVKVPNPRSGLAGARLASLAVLEGRSKIAIPVLTALAEDSTQRSARPSALYWLGKVHHASGSKQAAAAVWGELAIEDPLGYYGMQARDRLKEAVKFKFAADPVTKAEDRDLIRAGIHRYQVLLRAGLTREAEVELGLLRSHFRELGAGAQLALAEAFQKEGAVFTGISIGRELERSGEASSARLLRVIHPLPYSSLIVRSAQPIGLDPFFVAGLIRQESAFNPRAVSGAGAVGLMQVMPATAAKVAKSHSLNANARTPLTDVSYNLSVGTLYLREVMRLHDGRVDEVLAAYNAGPTRVTRWKSFPEHRDPDMWVERIPFEETRDYVRIVQRNARVYRLLYGDVAGSTR